MAKVLDLPAIPPFSVTETSSLAQRWDKWTKSLDYYIRASGISDQKQKRAILLHLAGAEVQEIFETLPETGDDYKTALEKLTEYFNPCKNIAFERHVFRQAAQSAGDTMDSYVTRLRTLAKTCQFDASLDEMIRDQIIEKCALHGLRRRLLRERELTLDNLLPIARSFELADRQALEIEQTFESSTHLNSIDRQRDYQRPRRNSAKHEDNDRQKSVCYCCDNTAVLRERYPIPTIEESLQDLNGAAVFSKLDLKWGYHQIELDQHSRALTTFTTHDGLYRYKRLMFGISAALEIYQHAIQQVLHGLPYRALKTFLTT